MLRWGIIILAFVLVFTGCEFDQGMSSYEGDDIFIITAGQDGALFTFNVGIDETSYDEFIEDGKTIEDLFLWIKPEIDSWGQNYYPLEKKSVSLEQLKLVPVDSNDLSAGYTGGVNVTFDFGVAARSYDMWWIYPENINGDDWNQLQGFSVIGASSYGQNWGEMEVGNEWAYFEGSFPSGDYISNIFQASLDESDNDGDGYEQIVVLGTNSGLYISDAFVEEDTSFFVRLQLDQYTTFGSLSEPTISHSSGFETLTDGNKNSVLSDVAAGKYVWEILVDGDNSLIADADQVKIMPDNYEQILQVNGSFYQGWSETKDVQYAGILTEIASTDFNGSSDFNMTTITSVDDFGFTTGHDGVYTEEINYPYTMTPDSFYHNWNIGRPSLAYDEDPSNLALGTGYNVNTFTADLNAPYDTMRNDMIEIPIGIANFSTYGEIWVIMDVYGDFSDSWEDRFSLEVGDWYDSFNDTWSYWSRFDLYEPIEWMWVGDRLINNGWKTVGINLGYLSDDVPIRFRFISDNFYDGRTGIQIDNLKIMGK
jgi:hypothetical protein